MVSAGRSRRGVRLPQSLHRDLGSYALAAGAAGVSVLALLEPAAAQIVYTPVRESIARNGKMLIDLNHDGITDVVIHELSFRRDGNLLNSVQAVPRGKGAGISSTFYAPGSALAQTRGARIGSGNRFTAAPARMANYTSFGSYHSGLWIDTDQDYLGIRFVFDGKTHYGWARLTLRYDDSVRDVFALLTGYAYETRPDTPIRAGDMGNDSAALGPESEVLAEPHQEAMPSRTLAALALGSEGLAIWRRE